MKMLWADTLKHFAFPSYWTRRRIGHAVTLGSMNLIADDTRVANGICSALCGCDSL
jgi:hypothetical protein